MTLWSIFLLENIIATWLVKGDDLVWHLKGHSYYHKSLQPDYVLSQMNPGHIQTWCFLKFHFYFCLGWGLVSGIFPSGVENVILHACIISHASYIPHPSHALWFKHPDNVWLGAQIQLAVSYVQIFPSSFCQTLLISVPPLGWVAKFHVHTKQGSIMVKHLETWAMKISSLMSFQVGIFQTWISNTTIY